jgi:hypothetical protein
MVQGMIDQRLFYPFLSWEKTYQGNLCSEINVEHFDLRKDCQIGYSHPNGTHNDVFWIIALAIYGTVEMQPEPLSLVPK